MAASPAPVNYVRPSRHFAVSLFRSCALLAALSLAAALPCSAHLGSPDVYFQGAAGPYRLSASIRTPQMIPGIAALEITTATPGVRVMRVQPLYITGEGSKYPPEPESLSQSKDDPNYFSGQMWLMGSGSWQVRVLVEGEQGKGEISIPVPAFARRTLTMQRGLGILLFALMILLVAAIVAIVAAAAREGTLGPNQSPAAKQIRFGRVAAMVALLVVIAALVGGRMWWTSSAAGRAAVMIYERPSLTAIFDGHDALRLEIGKTNWHKNRPDTVATALMPDHGHLMHLFLLRAPAMDAFYHLHPTRQPDGAFDATLPSIPAGHYKIFADIVRETGFPDTLIAELDLPAINGASLSGDDSSVINAVAINGGATTTDSALGDGSRMIWDIGPQPLTANRLRRFTFNVLDSNGSAVSNLEPYMGMPLHAEIVKDDFSVFAHVHPEGSISMAALMLANPVGSGPSSARAAMPDMPGMNSAPHVSAAELAFPFGFPQPGDYKIFVQVKRAGRVETAVFNAHVLP